MIERIHVIVVHLLLKHQDNVDNVLNVLKKYVQPNGIYYIFSTQSLDKVNNIPPYLRDFNTNPWNILRSQLNFSIFDITNPWDGKKGKELNNF